MEDDCAVEEEIDKIPSILNGKFFKITKVDETGKVLAKCCNCVNSSISGTLIYHRQLLATPEGLFSIVLLYGNRDTQPC
jgi:hypothetical protein